MPCCLRVAVWKYPLGVATTNPPVGRGFSLKKPLPKTVPKRNPNNSCHKLKNIQKTQLNSCENPPKTNPNKLINQKSTENPKKKNNLSNQIPLSRRLIVSSSRPAASARPRATTRCSPTCSATNSPWASQASKRKKRRSRSSKRFGETTSVAKKACVSVCFWWFSRGFLGVLWGS